MTRSHRHYPAALAAALLVTLVACEAKKSSNPLSPTVAGPIAGVEISAPQLIEPAQGFKFRESQLPVKLVIENSQTNGVRPITYTFEVATDSAFGNKVFSRGGIAPGDGNRTTVQIDALELGRAYYWRARADDGANNSAFATAGFELLPRAVLTAPALVSPVNNEQVSSSQPTLRIQNSQHNAAVGGVTYLFVVSRDQAFTQIVASGVVAEGGGSTSYAVNRVLQNAVTHFWRVRASDSLGEVVSDWSATQVFRGPAAPAPSPGPSPGPTNPGGPCNASNGPAIVSCERAKFGQMSHSQMAQLMRNIAASLNRNGISGAPFGILRKSGGTNCSGYSCDIVCAGNGGGQRQWDVLGDIDGAQTPAWDGPKSGSAIRVDVCEVQ